MKNEVVPANNAVAVSEIPEETIALSLTQQFEDIQQTTGQLFTKILHFGCALKQAELELDRRGALKDRKHGQGMQGWLSKHCPKLNYKTAMRWKDIATKAAGSLGCSLEDALKILTGEIVDVKGKLAKRRDDILSVDSQRQLLQMIFNFASEDSGSVGRPAGSAAEPVKITKVESARRMWAGITSIVTEKREAFYSSACLLPIDEARTSLLELKELVRVLEKRIKEGK